MKVFLIFLINIYMNYLVPMFDGILFSNCAFELKKGVKYALNFEDEISIVFPNFAQSFAFSNKSKNNVIKVKYKADCFYFLFCEKNFPVQVYKIKHKQKDILISLSSVLTVSVDGSLICEKNVENLKFSHYEIRGDFCFVYFEGVRNYLMVIQDEKEIFANYYDELNTTEDEMFFMGKCSDCLNHGSVCHLKKNEVSTYLVYLDNEDLNLKTEFVAHVYLDCVKSGNAVYTKNLLSEELIGANASEFFPKFDWFYPLNETTFVLTNKNTLVGIFEFQIENNKIVNIIAQD